MQRLSAGRRKMALHASAFAVEKAKKSGASESKIAAASKELAEFVEFYKSPFANIAMPLLELLPIGLLFALGSAEILSRKRRGEDVA